MPQMASEDSEDPALRNGKSQKADQLGIKLVNQTDKVQQKAQAHRPKQSGSGDEEKKGPAGGFDSTSIPSAPPGYTLKFTFHRAENLPFADLNTFSSDPYLIAVIKTDLLKRHKQDPDITLRTPTVHRNTNPEWNTEWVVANVPASGCHVKCRLYDEDPADHDDRLGNVHIDINNINEGWKGFKQEQFVIKKRMASKRAYTLRGCASLVSRRIKMGGNLVVSVENMGKTPGDDGGRMWTQAPLPWSRHFSPLIGRLTRTKDTEQGKDGKKGADRYNFQAIQIQLQGPVPKELYHRYVEFKPFVKGMFQGKSLRGRLLNKALHHQHARIYNYDRSTLYGIYQEPCLEMTKQFLEFVHYDQGGRIFTYVVTLDGQWRFTETGKEFGIDLLSKHTMHSNVNIYIAFSGEFFIRRLKHPHKNKSASPDPSIEALPPAPEPEDDEQRPESSEPSKDPNMYEMVIDNDSGTYRPNAKMLHTFKQFMAHNLTGMRVVTLDCQADEEKMQKLKQEQRDRKKNTGQQVTYLQNSTVSSISSSDEEQLDQRAEGHQHESKYKHEMHKFVGHGHDSHHGDSGDRGVASADGTHGGHSGHQQEEKTAEQEGHEPSNATDQGRRDPMNEKGQQEVNGSVDPAHQQQDVHT